MRTKDLGEVGAEVAEAVRESVKAKGFLQFLEDQDQTLPIRTPITDKYIPLAPLQTPGERLLIGVAGRARCGKDTVAMQLYRAWGFKRVAFADAVKRCAQLMFGLTDTQTWDDDLKEVEIPYWNMTPRRMFQMMGTEAGRSVFGQDLWVRRWLKEVAEPGRYVAPDVRFENEAEAIRARGGIIIHVTRIGSGLEGEAAGHLSEGGVKFRAYDWFICNDGTRAELNRKIDQVAKAYLESGAWG